MKNDTMQNLLYFIKLDKNKELAKTFLLRYFNISSLSQKLQISLKSGIIGVARITLKAGKFLDEK